MRRGIRAALALALLAVAAAGVAGCGGDGDEEPSVAAFCDKVEELQAMPDPLDDVGGGDVEGVRGAIDEYRDALDEVAEVAPQEIEGDLDMVRDAFDRFGDALADVEDPADLLQVARRFQGEVAGLQAAAQRLTEYSDENCQEGSQTG
jgi:hypothetical protein